MAQVLGVGGIFFKSRDPQALGAWYHKWLGVPFESHSAAFMPASMPAGGVTVWAPFAAATEYFAPSGSAFMFNLIVDNLDEALAQVKEGGAEAVGEIQTFDYGRFGWFMDPDGNKVELWEPK